MTQRAAGRADTTIEPRTNYTVVRLQQDLRGGQTGVGVLFTGVNRGLDAASAPFLRRERDRGAGGARPPLPRARPQGGGGTDLRPVGRSPPPDPGRARAP